VGDEPPDPLAATIALGEPSEKSSPDARTGAMVAHYRLGAPLGEGGMGVVYRAEDLKLGRSVAIKFLQRSDDQARARFLREARAASALDHPNIGTLYEIGEHQGAPFIVMALYQGETLRQRLQRGALLDDEILAIAQQLCRALEAAHQAGIVHRDLKPANIMLLADGTAKLLDFGLAKLTSIDESSLTREGAILGTLAYMAPEQLHNDNVDARADLWSLGAVLYEMLAQKAPFGSGPAATVVGRILADQPQRLEHGFLGEIALALLQKDPRRRPASAAEVGRLLEQRLAPKPRRAPLLVAGAAALLVAAAGAVVMLSRPAPQPKPLSGAELAAQFKETGRLSTLVQAADAFAAEGQARNALPLYRQFLLSAVNAPEAADLRKRQDALITQLFERSKNELVLGTYDDAAADFEVAYDARPDPSLLFERALELRGKRQWEKSREYFQRYLLESKDPDTVTVIANLRDMPQPSPTDDGERARKLYESGTVKFQAGDYDGSAADFEAAYALSREPGLLYNAAQNFRHAKQYSRALILYESFLRASPKTHLRKEVEARIEEMRKQVR
jgi:tetratricopeptide (TPR) repeat protein